MRARETDLEKRAFQSVDVKGCNADAKGYRVDVKGWCTHRGHDASGHDISDRNALNGNAGSDEAPPHWDPPPANARGVHHIHVQGALNIATCATVTRPMRARVAYQHVYKMTSFFGSSCANNGKDALDTPDNLGVPVLVVC